MVANLMVPGPNSNFLIMRISPIVTVIEIDWKF